MKRGDTKYVAEFSVAKLKQHKNNEYLYQDEPDDDLMESVKRSGIRTPLVVDAKTKTIISGHRRAKAAKLCGRKVVPIVLHYGLFEDEILMMLVDLNKQRVLTNEMRMREAALVKSAEAKRQTRLKKEANSEGKPTPKFEANATEVAADKTGLSTRQVERAVQVTKEIDKAVESGDTERADAIKKASEKSIAAAAKTAAESKKPRRKKSATRRVDPYTVDRKKMASQFREIFKKLEEIKKLTEELTETSGGPGHYSRQCGIFAEKYEKQFVTWRGDLK